MNKQTEALKMAIVVMQAFDNELPTNSAKEALQACKEALEQEKTPEEVIKNYWDNFKELK